MDGTRMGLGQGEGKFFNPKGGFRPKAHGCDAGATMGHGTSISTTPKGLRPVTGFFLKPYIATHL